jgi:hypothetical protein
MHTFDRTELLAKGRGYPQRQTLMPWRIKVDLILILIPFFSLLRVVRLRTCDQDSGPSFSWRPFYSIPRDVVSTRFLVEQHPA